MKYVATFTKTGRMIYTSHLDLIKVFLRGLRMAEIRPEYSHGYNPHPKMGFALPLSLGYHATSEYIEFETATKLDIESSVALLNTKLPEDVRVSEICIKPEKYNKSLASYVYAAKYEIMCEGIYDTPIKIENFFEKSEIIIKKTSKKTGRTNEINIRERMIAYRIKKDLKNRMLIVVTLRSDSEGMLNPSAFFKAFCDEYELDQENLEPVITRTAILDKELNALI